MEKKGDSRGDIRAVTVDVTATIRSVPLMLTAEMAGQIVGKATYISLANTCACRVEGSCQSFSADFGCLYLGPGARGIVEKGHAREIAREEALEHLTTAKVLGLVNMILWTSAEIRALGGDSSHALELCSCCPCCCLSRRTGNGQQAYIDGIVGLGLARQAPGCTACGLCELACPLQAIRLAADGPEINADRCKGCGLCAAACKQGALNVEPLENVPFFSEGWRMIGAAEYREEIEKIVAAKRYLPTSGTN